MGHPDGFPDALVPAAASPRLDPPPAGAIPPAPHASDASVAAPRDEAVDAPFPALAAARCVEKLAVPARVVLELASKLRSALTLPPFAEVLCTPDAVRFAA
jgi:hypothetical protein